MDPSSNNLMWQYLGTFVVYTGIVVAFLLLIAWVLKKNPDWLGQLKKGALNLSGKPTVGQLAVEETMALEANKQLHIIQCGQQRFLLATGTDSTQLLTELESLPTQPEASITNDKSTFLGELKQLLPQSFPEQDAPSLGQQTRTDEEQTAHEAQLTDRIRERHRL